MTSHHAISSITKYTRYHHKAYILSLKQQKILIDVAIYKFLIEQSYSCTIRYFDRPDLFCELVTWPTKISDDTLAFLFNTCNIYRSYCIVAIYTWEAHNRKFTISSCVSRCETDIAVFMVSISSI